MQKEYKIEATYISEELEGIRCLSIEEGQRKDNSTIVQPLLQHFMRIVLLQLYLCWLILHTRNDFQIIPS